MFFRKLIETIWYKNNFFMYVLLPFSWLYILLISLRRVCYHTGIFTRYRVSSLVVVVGNINVGGTGKTPLVIWLTEYFKQKGFRIGVVSRGYGRVAYNNKPQQVRPDSAPILVGDEPVLIAKKTGCPVVVATKRRKAAEELIKYNKCDLIICDDGMQHYSLERDIEIAVIDGHRRFGNGYCLPAGPLREPVSRLKDVDMLVSKYIADRHEFKMEYSYDNLVSIAKPTRVLSISELDSGKVHAVAGIGNPYPFFSYLRGEKLQVIEHEFPDHYFFTKKDICFDDNLPVIMTEKDAIKCSDLKEKNYWYLPVKVSMPKSFTYRLDQLLKEIQNG